MTILKTLSVVASKYTTKDGQEKTRWLTVGHLHEGTKGQYITLDPTINLAAIPRKEGDDRVYVNLFDPKPKGQQVGSGSVSAKRDELDDGADLPF